MYGDRNIGIDPPAYVDSRYPQIIRYDLICLYIIWVTPWEQELDYFHSGVPIDVVVCLRWVRRILEDSNVSTLSCLFFFVWYIVIIILLDSKLMVQNTTHATVMKWSPNIAFEKI